MRIIIAIFAVLTFSPVYAVEYSPVPDSIRIGKHTKADVPFNLDYLKVLWKKRISAIKEDGMMSSIPSNTDWQIRFVHSPGG